MPSRISGTKARYQRQLATAIKRARFRRCFPIVTLIKSATAGHRLLGPRVTARKILARCDARTLAGCRGRGFRGVFQSGSCPRFPT